MSRKELSRLLSDLDIDLEASSQWGGEQAQAGEGRELVEAS